MQAEEHALETLEAVATERRQPGLMAEARDARSALAERRFNVAVMGQFKRGKSTLINALVSRDLLPADVAPITSAITIVEHGEREHATVRYADGREEGIRLDEVRLFVSEEENPGNRKGVRAARVELPSPLLATGIRLVDTPGVGSVFAANSEVTRAFVSRIDVAVIVLGSDPPISGEELALVRAAAPGAGRTCFVPNKTDLVAPETRAKAEAFTRRVLGEALGYDPGPLPHTSALTALRGEAEPGVEALRKSLIELAAGSGAALARASAARAVRHVASHLLRQLDLEQAALTAPLEELDRRLEEFRIAMRDVDDLAIAALARAKAALSYDRQGREEAQSEFMASARAGLHARLASGLSDGRGASRRLLRARARDLAIAQTRSLVEEWHTRTWTEVARLRDRWLARAGEEANRLVDRVAAAASTAFGVAVPRFDPEALAIETKPPALEFFEEVLFLDPASIVVPLTDRLLPGSAVARRAASRATRLAEAWLDRNLGAVEERLVEWLDALARQLDGAMRARLDTVRQEVLDAIEVGRHRRQEGEEAIRFGLDEIARQRKLVLDASALDPPS